MSNSAVKVAVVGAGAMAREHIRAFQDVPEVSVVGLHSRTRARAEALAAEHGIPFVADSVDELAARTQADLVVVTVVEVSMRAVALACFEHPWTVLLEKPPGMDAGQARELLDVSRGRGRRVAVALNRRFLSSTLRVLEGLAADGGRRYVHVTDQQSLETARAIGHPEEVVRTWMYANSIHMVDYLRLLGRGNVTKVEPALRWDPARPHVVLATVSFESGDVGVYEGIWSGPGPWAVSVTTDGRRYEMRPLEEGTVQLAGERKRTPLPIDPCDAAFKPGFRAQAEAVVRLVRGQPSSTPLLGEAVESMELVERIFSA